MEKFTTKAKKTGLYSINRPTCMSDKINPDLYTGPAHQTGKSLCGFFS